MTTWAETDTGEVTGRIESGTEIENNAVAVIDGWFSLDARNRAGSSNICWIQTLLDNLEVGICCQGRSQTSRCCLTDDAR